MHVRDLAVPLVGEGLAHSLDTDPHTAVPAAGTPGRHVAVADRLWPPAVPDDIEGLPLYRHHRWDGMCHPPQSEESQVVGPSSSQRATASAKAFRSIHSRSPAS